MAQTLGDERSRRWLDKFDVDIGACRVFLGLKPEQQEAIRRMGGLGRSHPSGVLIRRIRLLFGYVDLATLMSSDDLDQRSRSPAFRIIRTQMNEKGSGKANLGRTQLNSGDVSPRPQQLPLGVEHFKGSGKGSLGDTIPLPEPLNVSRAEQPVASRPVITACKKMSPSEIDVWIRDNYKEVGNAWRGNILDLSTGMSVLWKGIKKGKSGGESTTYEYFNGKFHGWDDDAFVVVS
jgi:hypothetical protein